MRATRRVENRGSGTRGPILSKKSEERSWIGPFAQRGNVRARPEFTEVTEEKRGERGIGLLLVLLVVAVIALSTAGATVAFFALQDGAYAVDQTARYLPGDTQIYISLNFEPGDDQLGRVRDILARFRENAGFQTKLDELFLDSQEETGIHPEQDILPWLGPEVAFGFTDVVGSAVAGATGGTPLFVGFLGTTDSSLSLSVLRKWTDYREREDTDIEFETNAHKGVDLLSDHDADEHYAVTEGYVLASSDIDLLRETIDRLQQGEESPDSLYSNPKFQKVREALRDSRFMTLYVDTSAIWKDARRQFLGAEQFGELRQQLEDLIPDWVAVTGTFIDRGVDFEVSVATPDAALETAAQANSASASKLTPSDALVFASSAADPDLGKFRERLGEQRLDELAQGLPVSPGEAMGIDLGGDATLADLFDQGLALLKTFVGLDVEKDILSWMSGEVALGLLPTDFRKLSADPGSEALKAAIFLRFAADKRETVKGAMAIITRSLETAIGLEGEAVSHGDGEGVVFDLREMTGSGAYNPGYLVLGEHVVIATTEDTLQLTASASGGGQPSLADEPEYSRLAGNALGNKNPLVYFNLRDIVKAAVQALEPEERSVYRDSVEPFLQPLRALLIAGDTQPGLSRSSITLTIE